MMRQRVSSWLNSVKSPGVGGFALVVTFVVCWVSGSLWPYAAWFVTALGSSFDRGWNRVDDKHSSEECE